jgi:urease accessory protein
MNRSKRAIVVLSLLSSPAYAHHAEWMRDQPFTQGLSMPIHGLDHVTVALAVGLLGAEIGGNAGWAVAASFGAFVWIGGLLNVHGVAVPALEVAVLASTLVLGAMLVVRRTLPAWVALAAVAAIGAVQGGALFALPADPPPGWSLARFSSGCLVCAFLVMGIGALVRNVLRRTSQDAALRYAGVVVAVVGIVGYLVPAANEAFIRLVE